MYWYDNGWDGATNLKWRLDGGTITNIPAANLTATPGTISSTADTDGDGIPDSIEIQPPTLGASVPYDTDSDGIPDCEDLDSDADGVPDAADPNRTVASATDDVANATVSSATAVDVVANDDAGAGAGSVSVILLSNSGGGSTLIDATTGVISYVPVAGDAGKTVLLPYEVCVNGATACARATLRLTVSVPPAPTTVPPSTTLPPAPAPTTVPPSTTLPPATTLPTTTTSLATVPLAPSTTSSSTTVPLATRPNTAVTTTAGTGTAPTPTSSTLPVASSTTVMSAPTTVPFVDTDGDGIPDSLDPTPIVNAVVELLSIKRQSTPTGDTLDLVIRAGNIGRDTAIATSLVVNPIRGARMDTWTFGSWHPADGSAGTGGGSVFVGAQPTCFLDSGTLRCGLGDVAPGWVVDVTVTYVVDSPSAILQAGASITSGGFDTDLGNNVAQLAVESESVLRRVLPSSLAFTGVRFGLRWWLLSAILLLSLGGGFILLGSKNRRQAES